MWVNVYSLIRIVVVHGLVDQSEHNNCLNSYLLALEPTYMATTHRKQQRSLL